MLFENPSLETHSLCLPAWRSLIAIESSLVYACELWVFATWPALRGSIVSHVGVAHVSKNCLEYSNELLESAPPPPPPQKPHSLLLVRNGATLVGKHADAKRRVLGANMFMTCNKLVKLIEKAFFFSIHTVTVWPTTCCLTG